jgi:hypothetical protein
MTEHDCRFEKDIIEMKGDLKVLVSEFKSMNGSLRNTKIESEKHIEEGKSYRHRVDTMWSIIHFLKWLVALILGTGLLFNGFELWVKK